MNLLSDESFEPHVGRQVCKFLNSVHLNVLKRKRHEIYDESKIKNTNFNNLDRIYFKHQTFIIKLNKMRKTGREI